MLPFSFAKRHTVLLDDSNADALKLYYTDNTALDAFLEVQRIVDGALATERLDEAAFDAELQRLYAADENADLAIQNLDGAFDLSEVAEQLNEPQDLLDSADDAPIIQLINALLAEAIRLNASDIHIEPFEERLAVRLRVDGVLREIMQPPASVASLIASRVKIMAKLDIAEKRVPQDGRISLRLGGRSVDIRVSTIPAGYGERVVMRVLDKQAGRLELGQLGMDEATTRTLDDIVHQPHGIFLVTGPTGSGKTTTLYASLLRINDRERNVMTVEDPIEYFIDGIAQTQVNTKVDMTFARGLRAILRQDPDVVMVGEIRDLETAQIAVQASLTGHLVLSTLHTNSAVGAVTRLRDMGIEPFLLSSSLTGVLAQRLVRILCKTCREPYAADAVACEKLGLEPAGQTFYHARGCRACGNSGYRGRAAIYELVVMDEEFRTMIHDGAGEQDIRRRAEAMYGSIRQSGAQRVLAGDTTIEEVLRVTLA
ncbi:MAG: type II secretion system ATPase GspE [Gammaproteobacteria bacterium]|nr:type II secretion system ATPase GspE [Gammaproteobacteria bacterium]